jgi:hypothetical protein
MGGFCPTLDYVLHTHPPRLTRGARGRCVLLTLAPVLFDLGPVAKPRMTVFLLALERNLMRGAVVAVILWGCPVSHAWSH